MPAGLEKETEFIWKKVQNRKVVKIKGKQMFGL